MGIVDVRAADLLWQTIRGLNLVAWNEEGGYFDPEDRHAEGRYATSRKRDDGSMTLYRHVEEALIMALTHVTGGRRDRAEAIRDALADSGEDVGYHLDRFKRESWDAEDATYVRTFRVPNVWPDGRPAMVRVEIGPVVRYDGSSLLPAYRVSVDGNDVAANADRADYDGFGEWSVFYAADLGTVETSLELLTWLYYSESDAERTRVGDWVRMRCERRDAIQSEQWRV